MILAIAHRRGGRIPDAIDLLERVASLEPENPLLVRSLAPALASVGRMGFVADALLDMHPDASSPGLVAESARFLALAGWGDRLLILTQHAENDIEAMPIEAIGLRALALFETDRDAQAGSLLDALSQESPPPAPRAWA